ERNLSKASWSSLLEGHYIRAGENILITGPTGCWKSFAACALGHQACLMGIKTRYFNMNRLIETIIMAKTEGSYMKLLNQRNPAVNCLLSEMWGQNSFARKQSWQKMNQSGSRCLQA
ncbi:MAG TPA: ATP-binding protein, partial [Chitinophagaceae bacterium]|nr:ATP-binding protein [Chitinophagaceae bacterium]